MEYNLQSVFINFEIIVEQSKKNLLYFVLLYSLAVFSYFSPYIELKFISLWPRFSWEFLGWFRC